MRGVWFKSTLYKLKKLKHFSEDGCSHRVKYGFLLGSNNLSRTMKV